MNAVAFFPRMRRYKLLRRPSEPIMPSSPRPVRRDCHGRLMVALLDLAGPDSRIGDDRLTPWASATFIGARHDVTVVLAGEDAVARAASLADMLPDAEFTIRGHLVADLAIEARQEEEDGSASLRLSILTIEQW